MNRYFLFIIGMLLSITSFADIKPSKHKCLDLMGGLQIIAKVGDHTYEADYWNWGVPRTRIVLVANTEFKSTGLVYRHFWAEVVPKAEKVSVQLNNGFTKDFHVLRESDVCTAQEGNKVSK